MKRFLFFFVLFALLNIPLGATNSYLQSYNSINKPDINTNDIICNKIEQSAIPDFNQESLSISDGPGTYNVTGTIQHSGIEATPGITHQKVRFSDSIFKNFLVSF